MWQLSFPVSDRSEAADLRRLSNTEEMRREVLRRCGHFHEPFPDMVRDTPVLTIWGMPLLDRSLLRHRASLEVHRRLSSCVVLVRDAVHPIALQGAGRKPGFGRRRPPCKVAAQVEAGQRLLETMHPNQAGCKGSVCCRRGGTCRTNCRTNQTGSMCTNQNSGWTCLEPGDLPGSEATGKKPRCSMGEGVYSPSHF